MANAFPWTHDPFWDGLHYSTDCEKHDYVRGTKQQLQALGLGVGLAFPGEPGAPKKEIQTTDPRGHQVTIRKSRDGGEFAAYVRIPCLPPEPCEFDGELLPSRFSGVAFRERLWFDEYVGSAEALTTAGLVPAGCFPGWPGMRRVRVRIFADGSLPGGAPTANWYRASEPGAKTVEFASKAKALYLVRVRIERYEEERRIEALDAWRVHVRSLPRPVRLIDLVTGNGKRQCNSSFGLPTMGTPRATSRPAHRPLFGDAPTAPQEKQAYQKHVFDSLKDLVDFAQTSAY